MAPFGRLAKSIIGIVALWMSVGAQPAPPQGPPLIDRVRAALGGADRLAAIRSGRLAGTETGPNRSFREGTDLASNRSVSLALELTFGLPDRYRMDLSLTSDRRVFTEFRGPTLAPGSSGLLEWAQQDFARAMLWLLLRTDTAYAMRPGAERTSSLTFTEPDGTEIVIDIDPASALPRRATFDKRPQSLAPDLASRRVPTVVEFSDYQDVDGLTLSHRWVERANGAVARERRWRAIQLESQ